jgi:mRNA-degrading endonuclease toxin of MazEF toxin-antitoxin module
MRPGASQERLRPRLPSMLLSIGGLSTEVAIGPEDGARVSSVVNLDNLQLIDRNRLVRRVGHVRPETLRRICDAAPVDIGCA